MGNTARNNARKRSSRGTFEKNTQHNDGDTKKMPTHEILDDTRHKVSVGREDIEAESNESEQSKLLLVDEVTFNDVLGNTIKLKFLKTQGRLYKLQIMLNDSIEIKPVTYSGSSIGFGYWNLIKGLMKMN